MVAIKMKKMNPEYSISDSSKGPESFEKIIGVEHCGLVGTVQVRVALNENGTCSISIGTGTMALSRELTNDLKEILNPDSVSLAS
jgi:hypothetical protein